MAYCVPADFLELGYTWDDTTDMANITAICDTASVLVDAYCKQSFFPPGTGYAETHQARVRGGVIKVFPLNMTVNAIESITFIGIESVIPFTCTNMQYMAGLGYIVGATNAPNGNYLITLTYDYGFAAGSIPDDLVKATVLVAAPLLDDYFLSRDSNVSMVKMIKQGELTIQRQDTDDMPNNAKKALEGGNHGRGYVRVRAG
jgi:hypothetical protein